MMDRRLSFGFSSVYFLLLFVSEVKGTLSPSNRVSLDCGSQQTFICNVTGVAAVWTITGLSEITAVTLSGQVANVTNARITTTDTSGATPSSTITITGFTAADDGGRVQCINLADSAVQGMATVAVGTPSCPTIIASARNKGFTAANVTWSQPATLPVTSTVVTYCPKSSPNCGNSVNCTSPCIISGLDPCANYSVAVTPSNNCGSATGCDPMNTVDSLSQGDPETPTNFIVETNNDCSSATAKWAPSALATSTIVSYCPVPSRNFESNIMCTNSPCTITGLTLTAGYNFRAVHKNNCGSSSGSPQVSTSSVAKCISQLIGGAVGGAIGGCLLLGIIIAVVIVVICYCCPCARSVCCCCVSNGSKRSTSTEPTKPRPGGEYADPQKVRENKESGKQGVTYAALEFTEQAGSTGGQNVRSKEQPVQYMAVEHA